MSLPSHCILNSTISDHGHNNTNTTGVQKMLLSSCASKVDIHGITVAQNKNVKCDISHGIETEVIS